MPLELDIDVDHRLEASCPAGLSAEQEVTVTLLRQAMRSIRRAIDCRLRSHGLTYAQWKTLLLLHQGGTVTPTDVVALAITDAGREALKLTKGVAAAALANRFAAVPPVDLAHLQRVLRCIVQAPAS